MKKIILWMVMATIVTNLTWAQSDISGTDVTSIYITNPQPTSNANGWDIDGSVTQFQPGYNIAEFWNQSGASIHQTITLPAGGYRLTAVAFTRTDMLAKLFAGDTEMNIATVSSSEVNNLSTAKIWLDAGNGVNKLEFTQAESGDITIGLTADKTTSDHWMVWRSFKLEQLIDESLLPGSPTFSIESGKYGEELTLALTADEGLTIYYNLNGGTFTEYTEPLTISRTTTVNAYAMNADQMRSKTVSKKYYIATLTLPTTVNSIEDITPIPASLESGKYYYLYNVDAQMFIGRRINDYSYPYLRDYVNERILVTKQNNGYYTMQYSNNNYYLYATGYGCVTESSISDYTYWRFVDAGNGLYYIQRNGNYNASHYLGWASGDSYLYSNKSADASNNIRWQLIEADDDALAMAQRMMLYKAINYAGGSELWPEYVPMVTDEAQTASSLYNAATRLYQSVDNAKTDAPVASWNEVAMSFWSDDTWWRSTTDNVAYYSTASYSNENTDGIMSLSARVSINEASKLVFDTYSSSEGPIMDLWVNGHVVKSLNPTQLYNEWCYSIDYTPQESCENTEQKNWRFYTTHGYQRYILDLPEGLHTLEWRYTESAKSSQTIYLRNIGIISAPTPIEVSYSDAGSLGTEVLRQVNNVNDVRRLKITGPMNDDDWARIAMMTRLVALDLSDATITSFPAKKFDNYTTENWPFLHELKLPKTLQSIWDFCFRNSYVEHIDIPESVTSIGYHAFYHSQIHEANISSHVSSIGDAAFARCYFLEDVTYQPTIDFVPTYTFMYDNIMNPFELPSFIENVRYRAFDLCNRFNTTLPASLKTVEYGGFGQNFMLDSQLPESLMTVGELAFYHCYKLNSKLPASLKTIGFSAFERTALDSIDIPAGVTTIGNYAFNSCSNASYLRVPESVTSIGEYTFANCGQLEYAELPASYANIASGYLFSGSTALKTLKIKSPTLLGGTTSTFVNGVDKSQITLQVPDYLVTAYKLDDYWYNFGGFEGFSTEEVKDWVIQYPLTLSQHDRFLGTPNVDVKTVNFIIQGQTGMELNDFNMDSSNGTSGYSASTQIMSSSNDININGELSLDYYTTAKRWFFLSLPFDIQVGDLETTMQYAIAYYDGASRAANNSASGNWKDYTANDIIPAGTGFIYQTNAEGWTRFKALDTSSKNRAFAARDISLDLTEHPAESSANTGWNLVGNPWMTYFNNHSIDFTAPFTIWNPSNSTYTAYSLIDDDYALRPNQAIFVQCPEGTNSITFPARGRQLTSVIENQNGVKAQVAQNRERRIIDLTLTANEQTDQTRIVMNPQAAIGYEMNCDASKFFTIERAPQLYSLDDDGTAYAINERPMEDGTVRLAFVAPSEGTYTISMPRCQTSYAMLQDKETGESTDLSQGDYTFYSGNGTYTNRLELFVKDTPTGIEGPVDQQHAAIRLAEGGIQADIEAEVYGLDGRLLKSGKGFLRMPNGAYIVRVGTSKVKVVVK